jgi:ribosomal protein S14
MQSKRNWKVVFAMSEDFRITPPIADELVKKVGGTKDYWLKMQELYDKHPPNKPLKKEKRDNTCRKCHKPINKPYLKKGGLCRECLQEYKEQRNLVNFLYLEAGLCPKCHNKLVKHTEKRYFCEECKKIHIMTQRDIGQKFARIEKGICPICGKHPIVEGNRCELCWEITL